MNMSSMNMDAVLLGGYDKIIPWNGTIAYYADGSNGGVRWEQVGSRSSFDSLEKIIEDHNKEVENLWNAILRRD